MEHEEINRAIKKLPKGSKPSKGADFELLPGGSDRKFVRISDQGKKAILMISDPIDKEFNNYLQIQQYLFSKSLGVPEIYFYDKACRILLMEDLGSHSVEYLAKEVLKSDDVIKMYKGIVVFLAELQIEGYKGYDRCQPIKDRRFDYDVLRWETSYFREYFLEKFCHIEPTRTKGLDKEFDYLAKGLVDEPLFFMHRDFQSQNIFIKEGKVRIVDFQGARQGLLAYDLAAILKDAYVVLKDDIRNLLIDYYLTYLEKIKGLKFERDKFYRRFYWAGLQRNMQALGAFAYLSMVKEKNRYIRYVPAGMKYLDDALVQDEGEKFPKLRKIVEDAQKFLTHT